MLLSSDIRMGKDICWIAKVNERKSWDLGDIRWIKDVDKKIHIDNNEIKEN